MEYDHDVQRTLELVYSAALSPPEHKLLSCFVLNSVDPKTTVLYVIQRASGGSETELDQDVDLGIRRLLADWKELVGRCRFYYPLPTTFECLNSPNMISVFKSGRPLRYPLR
jgi:hypothetical protein